MSKKKDLKIGNKDVLFETEEKASDFSFNEKVASVFDDMVSRSVPLYNETMDTALGLAKQFIQPNSNVYDIGCSTATLLIQFLESCSNGDNIKFIGIDNSEHMLIQASSKLNGLGIDKEILLRNADIEQDMGIENASVVFLNYTLQFVRPLHREKVLKQIYKGLNKNGCLILVEKVLGNNSLFNRQYIDLYYQYKKTVGYSQKEIQKKREALENVLIPYRIDENIELLKRVGFSSTDIFFKWYNFAGIVAVKD